MTANIGLLVFAVFAFLLLFFHAIAWLLEEYAPLRDEDAELDKRYPIHRRHQS